MSILGYLPPSSTPSQTLLSKSPIAPQVSYFRHFWSFKKKLESQTRRLTPCLGLYDNFKQVKKIFKDKKIYFKKSRFAAVDFKLFFKCKKTVLEHIYEFTSSTLHILYQLELKFCQKLNFFPLRYDIEKPYSNFFWIKKKVCLPLIKPNIFNIHIIFNNLLSV